MRGMEKWLPFKSLDGQYEVIDEMIEERNKVEKPILSPEEEEEINECLCSLNRGDRVSLSYFEDGKIIQKEAVFKSVSPEFGKLYLTDFALNLSMLLSISRTEE